MNRFVFLNLPILSLGGHLGVTVSPQPPLPAGSVSLPVDCRSPPLGLIPPCNLVGAISASGTPAVADGRPAHPGAKKPVPQLGSPSVVPLDPNSRLGSVASPLAQGRVKMDAIVVGIDVSKDKLDIAVRPSGEIFSTSRDAAGLDALIARLAPL